MAAMSIRQALLAGPSLIRRQAPAVAAWVVLGVAQQLVYLAVLLGSRTAPVGAGAGAVWGALVYLPFEAVLIAAVFRAFLRPEQGRAAFLRLGPVELRMIGLLVLGTLLGLLIALPVSMASAYAAFFFRQVLLAGAALSIGSLVAGLALLRFAPTAPILVETGRVDLRAAWASTRGQFVRMAALMLAVVVIERVLLEVPAGSVSPPPLSWRALVDPTRLFVVVWHAVVGTVALATLCGVVLTAWRSGGQTVD